MNESEDWRKELDFIVGFMQELSLQTDPQLAANLYGRRLREGGLTRSDGFLAISRRDLQAPAYRITRSSTWKQEINPWKQKDLLPVHTSGILSEIIYSNKPAIIEDLPAHYSPDDPAAEYFKGMKSLVASPQFDNGEAINMSVLLNAESRPIEYEKLPMMVLQANLWGRTVLSSVLRQELTTAYNALDKELKIVADIQRSLLPTTLPRIQGLDLHTHYETSQRAGGDYYDFFALPGGQWGIFIADVSGHGVPAAVIMAITHAIAHTRPGPNLPPGEMLCYLNRTLERRYTGQRGSFVTAFYAVYDPATRQLTYSSAGHPPPRRVSNGRIFSLDGPAGLPLGIDSPEHYPDHTITLKPGDTILMFTDGVTEAFNQSRDQYGVERLDKICLENRAGARELIEAILADLEKFAEGRRAADDQTLLAMCVLN